MPHNFSTEDLVFYLNYPTQLENIERRHAEPLRLKGSESEADEFLEAPREKKHAMDEFILSSEFKKHEPKLLRTRQAKQEWAMDGKSTADAKDRIAKAIAKDEAALSASLSHGQHNKPKQEP